MKLRTLMLHADSDEHYAKRLTLAVALARQHQAKLFVLCPILPPVAPMTYAEYVPPQAIEAQVEAERNRAEELRKLTTAAATGIDCEWRAVEGQPEAVLPAASGIADVVIMGQSSTESDSATVASVALTSGRPLLCVPHTRAAGPFGKTILLAWNGSREAARAAHDALPFLTNADKVLLFSAPEDEEDEHNLEDAAAHLGAHGAKIELLRTKLGDLDIGSAILNAVSDHNADMIVMGAYGHSRLREWVFGGATRTILQSMTVPTLLSH